MKYFMYNAISLECCLKIIFKGRFLFYLYIIWIIIVQVQIIIIVQVHFQNFSYFIILVLNTAFFQFCIFVMQMFQTITTKNELKYTFASQLFAIHPFRSALYRTPHS